MKPMLLLPLTVLAVAGAAWAQTAPPPIPAGSGAQQEAPVADIEVQPQLRAQMEAALAEWLKLDHDIVEVNIPQWLKRDPCHPRVKLDLDKVVAAMKNYHKLEMAYWKRVSEFNLEQISALESLGANQEEAVKDVEGKRKIEEEELREAQRRLEEVKKLGEEAAIVKVEGEALVQKIEATNAHLRNTLAEATKAQTLLSSHQNLIYFRKKLVEAGLRNLESTQAEYNQLYLTKRGTFAGYCRPIVPPDTGVRIVGPATKK